MMIKIPGLRSASDRPLVVIETPFKANANHSQADHVRYARWCCRHSMLSGEWPFASHLLYPQFMNDGDTIERNLGVSFSISMGCYATQVVFYTDLGISSGMAAAAAGAAQSELVLSYRKLPAEMFGYWQAGEAPL